MTMRTYGEINGICFRRQGFDIYSHGIKYKLISEYGNTFVSVNSMKELKEEINKFKEVQHANNSHN